MSPAQQDALTKAATAFIEACDTPHGTPEGPLYAALMQHGCTLQQFEQFKSGLTRCKMIEAAGNHILRATDAGRAYAAKMAPRVPA